SVRTTAKAMCTAGAQVTVVQPAHEPASFDWEGVHYDFGAVQGVQWLRGNDIRRTCDAVAATRPQAVHLQGLNTPRAVRTLRRTLGSVPIIAQDRGTRAPAGWRRLAHNVLNRGLSGV